MTITYSAIEFDSAGDAIQNRNAAARPSWWAASALVVGRKDAERLAAAGVELAYLIDHEMPDGERRLMTVPVN